MADVIRARGLTKFYGRSRGVVELDFAVVAGEVFGFLGPNSGITFHGMMEVSPHWG